jgi:hypothetical protein
MLYLSNDSRYLFVVNLKCGYSTFEQMHASGLVRKLNIRYDNNRYEKVVLDTLDMATVRIVMIVRDPLDRFFSFYQDKFVRRYAEGQQDCQLSLYAQLGTKRRISIHELVHAIREGYHDGHLLPQKDIVSSCTLLRPGSTLYKVPIELLSASLPRLLGLPKIPHANISGQVKGQYTLSPCERAFIEDVVYDRDRSFVREELREIPLAWFLEHGDPELVVR